MGFSLAAGPRLQKHGARSKEHRARENDFFSHCCPSCFLFCLRPLTSDFCHLITLSALASTFGGIVTPISFAVFTLITSSIFCRLLHGQVCRLCSLEDLVDVDGGAPELIAPVMSIRDETTGLRPLGVATHRWNTDLGRKF